MDLKKIKITKKMFAEITFWLHLPIVIVLFGLFAVPKLVWTGKVTFHFWYFVGIIFVQILWATLFYKKNDMICPLTTLMQWLRGYPIKSKKNYGHSFIAELLKKMRIKISYAWVNVVLIVCLIIVIVQYIWFR